MTFLPGPEPEASALTQPRESFTPKLITVLSEGYGLAALRRDVIAGLTVAVVALPLSMAIAIASGASPERGLYTAVIGGFLISALGGSRFQIGGPAGAFIVLVATTIQQHGIEGLWLAMLMAGAMMIVIGVSGFGAYIRYIPHPVTVGFTAGIALIIFFSQMKDVFGLTLTGPEPAELTAKLASLVDALPSLNPRATAVAFASLGLMLAIKRYRPGWPNMLIAVALAALATAAFDLPIETIGRRFGGIPSGLPAPSFPPVSLEAIGKVLPNAFAIALLGGIESLLSAVVADGMSGRRHRSGIELVAQGIANMACAVFGGICATGTIARTATNVRAAAHGPVAGMLHAVFLLTFMVVAAPLAAYIPLATLGAVLTLVAWNMVEKREVWLLLTRNRPEAVVLTATLLLTLFRDLTEGIVVGVLLGSLVFTHRMSQLVAVREGNPRLADADDGVPGALDDAEVVFYQIEGPFFFGAAATIASVMDRLGASPRVYVLDLARVPVIDSTGAETVRNFVLKAKRHGARVILTGTSAPVRSVLHHHGVHQPLVALAETADAGLKLARMAA